MFRRTATLIVLAAVALAAGTLVVPAPAAAQRAATKAERSAMLAPTKLQRCLWASTSVVVSTADQRYGLVSPRSGGVRGCTTGDGSFLVRRATRTSKTWRSIEEGSAYFCDGVRGRDKALLDFRGGCPIDGPLATKLGAAFAPAATAAHLARPGMVAGSVTAANVACGMQRATGAAYVLCTGTGAFTMRVTGGGTTSCDATVEGHFPSIVDLANVVVDTSICSAPATA